MLPQIFISKNESEVQDLIRNLSDKYTFIAHSFLKFNAVDFEVQSKYNILFFSSPRSIIFFKSKYSIPSNVQIACVGSKTKSLLSEMGHKVSFYRTNSQSLSDFALSFMDWCKNKRVLFPISSISLRTISSHFPNNQIEEVIVYSTEIKGKEIEECDFYIFTSPSNVEGFLQKNSFPHSSKIISWGESTSRFIIKQGGKVDIELKESNLFELEKVLVDCNVF